jgi:hypothetical protein
MPPEQKMPSEVQRDFDWQLQFVPLVRQIIGPLLLMQAPYEMDVKRNADLIVLQTGKNQTIAMRVRRPRYFTAYGLQFTIRWHRDSGAETEMSKIKKGFGDWFFYGIVENDDAAEILRHWVVIDLAVFRRVVDDAVAYAQTIDNHDGTYGKAFEIRRLPPEGLIACSETMTIALARGLGAVPPPGNPFKETQRPPKPPDLQALVAKHGGYHKITSEAWAEWDRLNEDWKQARSTYYRTLGVK